MKAGGIDSKVAKNIAFEALIEMEGGVAESPDQLEELLATKGAS